MQLSSMETNSLILDQEFPQRFAMGIFVSSEVLQTFWIVL